MRDVQLDREGGGGGREGGRGESSPYPETDSDFLLVVKPAPSTRNGILEDEKEFDLSQDIYGPDGMRQELLPPGFRRHRTFGELATLSVRCFCINHTSSTALTKSRTSVVTVPTLLVPSKPRRRRGPPPCKRRSSSSLRSLPSVQDHRSCVLLRAVYRPGTTIPGPQVDHGC
jgi:hypothetical protein